MLNSLILIFIRNYENNLLFSLIIKIFFKLESIMYRYL